MPAGWVYLITDGEAVKIGLTTGSVDRRNRQHQTGNPRPIETVYQFWAADVNAAEAALHRQYSDKRLGGEWFSLTDGDIESIIDAHPSGRAGPAYMNLRRRLALLLDALRYLVLRR